MTDVEKPTSSERASVQPSPAQGDASGLQDVELKEIVMERASSRGDVESMKATAPPFPVKVVFDDLRYSVDIGPPDARKKKVILSGISGVVKPGELLAVMGPTGAGKSTFLNLLAGQVRTGTQEGKVLFNGRPRSKWMKRYSAYVLQDDTFFSNLTVRETLTFSALLRLPSSMSRQEKMAAVDRTIKILNIQKCENSLVGGMFVRGISGGEKRRLNIGNEILMNPSLLMCDEPTSGLDSSTAHAVLDTLVDLAHTGRTVIITIHQPSSIMFNKFDKLLLLAQGHCIYFGAAKNAVDFFSSQGFPCPMHFNPADFLLEMITDEELKGGAAKIEPLAHAFKAHYKANLLEDAAQPEDAAVARPPDAEADEDVEYGSNGQVDLAKANTRSNLSNGKHSSSQMAVHPESRWATTFWDQFYALCLRNFTQTRGVRIRPLYMFQYLAMALIVGMVWFRMEKHEEEIDDRVGMLFFSAVFWSFNGLFNAMTTFPSERPVVSKERASGAYRVSSYFLAKCFSDLPIELFYPTVFVIITYWMTGLSADGGKFICFWLTILLTDLTSQSIGLAISTAVMDFQKSLVYASVLMLGFMLIAGFYVDNSNIPVWIRWIQHLAFIKYSFVALMQIEFRDDHYRCATGIPSSYESCPAHDISGAAILDRNDVNDIPVGGNIAVLFSMMVVIRFVAYVNLRLRK